MTDNYILVYEVFFNKTLKSETEICIQSPVNVNMYSAKRASGIWGLLLNQLRTLRDDFLAQ